MRRDLRSVLWPPLSGALFLPGMARGASAFVAPLSALLRSSTSKSRGTSVCDLKLLVYEALS